MQSTFETVAAIIASVSDVTLESIRPESHMMRDLSVDSLGFLDIAFEIDQKFGIKLPVEDWFQVVNEGKAKSEDYFVLGNLCRHIDELVSVSAAA